jgi:hypothetical protein
MDIKEKIVSALQQPLGASYIRLDDDDGISGFVVADRFVGMSTLDRQRLIDDALGRASPALEPQERRRVLMIAALTPAEYDAVGANIMVLKVKERAGGSVEVLVNGGLSDVEYVRGALKLLKGVKTTEPKQTTGPAGTLMSFRAEGSKASPLSKDTVVHVLERQPYVTVMPGA